LVATKRPNRVGERAGNAQEAEPRQNLKRGAGGARRRPTTEQRSRGCVPLGWGLGGPHTPSSVKQFKNWKIWPPHLILDNIRPPFCRFRRFRTKHGARSAPRWGLSSGGASRVVALLFAPRCSFFFGFFWGLISPGSWFCGYKFGFAFCSALVSFGRSVARSRAQCAVRSAQCLSHDVSSDARATRYERRAPTSPHLSRKAPRSPQRPWDAVWQTVWVTFRRGLLGSFGAGS
jgi:hypothetical protein